MSAAFRYSHRDITNLDLRHIYSGELVSSRTRPPIFHDGINYLDRIHEAKTRHNVSNLPRKSFEYSREYSIVLPRAPAFRRFSKTKVERVVDRLVTQTDKNELESHQKGTRIASAPPAIARNETPKHTSPVPKRHLSQKDIHDIADRLFHARTMTTKLRQREKVDVTQRATSPLATTTHKAVEKRATSPLAKTTHTAVEKNKKDIKHNAQTVASFKHQKVHSKSKTKDKKEP